MRSVIPVYQHIVNIRLYLFQIRSCTYTYKNKNTETDTLIHTHTHTKTHKANIIEKIVDSSSRYPKICLYSKISNAIFPKNFTRFKFILTGIKELYLRSHVARILRQIL